MYYSDQYIERHAERFMALKLAQQGVTFERYLYAPVRYGGDDDADQQLRRRNGTAYEPIRRRRKLRNRISCDFNRKIRGKDNGTERPD